MKCSYMQHKSFLEVRYLYINWETAESINSISMKALNDSERKCAFTIYVCYYH